MGIITCQHEWIRHCRLRYITEPPTGYHWEDAHYPLPKCKEGANTVNLWYPDHVVHGALQTLNLSHPCMHGFRCHIERQILKEVYPEYIDLYEEAYTLCQHYAGRKGCQKAGRIGGRVTKERGVGIFDPLVRSQSVEKTKELYSGEKRSEAQRKRARTLGKEKLGEIARKTNRGRMKAITVEISNQILHFESIRSAARETGISRDHLYKSLKTGKEVHGIKATYSNI